MENDGKKKKTALFFLDSLSLSSLERSSFFLSYPKSHFFSSLKKKKNTKNQKGEGEHADDE